MRHMLDITTSMTIIICLGVAVFILCLAQCAMIRELERRQNALERLLEKTRGGLATLSAALRAAESGDATAASLDEWVEEKTTCRPAIPMDTRLNAEADWVSRIGKRWLTWGGVLLYTATIGYLLKYEWGWINHWAQIGIGMAAGYALGYIGDWQIRHGMHSLGEGTLALGLFLFFLTCMQLMSRLV